MKKLKVQFVCKYYFFYKFGNSFSYKIKTLDVNKYFYVIKN